MYNGIGLTTPRGSGTNGYVQRNMSFVPKSKDKVNYRTEEDLKKLDAMANKKPNEGILAHERKRGIELKCLEMQELMEQQGYSEKEINEKVAVFRKLLLDKEDGSKKPEIPKDDFGRPIVKESHQMAEANQEKNVKMREALGISQYFVEGSSLDPARKAREAAAAAKAEAQRKYSLVPDSSSSPSPERESEKDKAKKKKKPITDKRSDEESSHKKKKISKKHKRERSYSPDDKQKKKSKKPEKPKSTHKRDKHGHRSDSSVSHSSYDSANRLAYHHSSASSHSVHRSRSKSVGYSDSDVDRSPSRQRKQDLAKRSKTNKSKEQVKDYSSDDSGGHSHRKSRKDRYESSKKKLQLIKGASKRRSDSSSSSSDNETPTAQYYRLEPVFVKSKSKHKKELQLIDLQGKKKLQAGHELIVQKHVGKKKKRPRHSSSSSSDSEIEHIKLDEKKRRKHSLSPVAKTKHSHQGLKKHGRKHKGSTSDDDDELIDEKQRSLSRSLSYSPIPNSRSNRASNHKKSETQYEDAILSGRHKEKELPGGKKSKGKKNKRQSTESDIDSDLEELELEIPDRKSRKDDFSSHKGHSSKKHASGHKLHSRLSLSASPLPETKRKKRRHSSETEHSSLERIKKKNKGLGKSSPSHRTSARSLSKSPVPSHHKQKKKKKMREASTDSIGSSDSDYNRGNKKAKGKISQKKRGESCSPSRDHSRSVSDSPKRGTMREKLYKGTEKLREKDKVNKREKRKKEWKYSSERSHSKSPSRTEQRSESLSSKQSKNYGSESLASQTSRVAKKLSNKEKKALQDESTPSKDKRGSISIPMSPVSKKKSNYVRDLYADEELEEEEVLEIKINKKKSESPLSKPSKLVEKYKGPSSDMFAVNEENENAKSKDPAKSSGSTLYSPGGSTESGFPKDGANPKRSSSREIFQKSQSPNHDQSLKAKSPDKTPVAFKINNKNLLSDKVALIASDGESPDVSKTEESNKTPMKGKPLWTTKNFNNDGKGLEKSTMGNKTAEEVSQNGRADKMSPKSKSYRRGSRSKSRSPARSWDSKRRSRSSSRSASRGKSKRASRSRTGSRSPRREKSHSEHSNHRERSKTRSHSRSRSKSPRGSRSHSRSRSRSYTHSRSRTRSRSKSYSRSRSRSRSYASRSHSRSAARSPSIPRRKGSPSFLDKRRITSARKRPVPYRRPSPLTPSSTSSWSYHSHSRSSSPYQNHSRSPSSKRSSTVSRSRSISWSPQTRQKYEISLNDIMR